ncbi:hypothetical protein QTO34_014728 [Cnephaeus nilssonii]|uniref:Serpin domain-containing protein n=1 Tax=Cnephaeus nilssonii TaxID=3371016 RepID=A0AA40I7W2_CNENI|nr:hypothetical protein QTO34_014728 [Eptesicus nilssonii]
MFKILWSLLLTFSGSQASRPLAQRNTEFAVDLYQAICSSQKDNIIFSPLGTTLILGMVQLGAKGKAYQQIRQTLKVQENSTGEEFSALKSFFSAISKKKQEFTFNLANALYLQEGFTVKEQYLHGNEKFFQSAIKLVDFQNAKACAETISAWVESKTDGKILDLLDLGRIWPSDSAYPGECYLFQGDWKQKFRKEGTELMNFTKKDGAKVKIPMMKALLRTKYGYFSESSMKYQVLELPYKDDEFSLIIILPAEEVNIEDIEKRITADLILKWFSEMQEEEVEISLPRLVIFYYSGLHIASNALTVIDIQIGGRPWQDPTVSNRLYPGQVLQGEFWHWHVRGHGASAGSSCSVACVCFCSQNVYLINTFDLFGSKIYRKEYILLWAQCTNLGQQQMTATGLFAY